MPIPAANAQVFIPAQMLVQSYEVDLFYHYNSQIILLIKKSQYTNNIEEPIMLLAGCITFPANC
jgi:hypothetical protein